MALTFCDDARRIWKLHFWTRREIRNRIDDKPINVVSCGEKYLISRITDFHVETENEWGRGRARELESEWDFQPLSYVYDIDPK